MTLREAWAKSWSVNVTSTHAVTEALVPRLIKSSNPRLLFITSGTSALTTTENPKIPANSFPAAGWPKTDQAAFQMIPAYRSSKTGLNMVMRYVEELSPKQYAALNLLRGCISIQWYQVIAH